MLILYIVVLPIASAITLALGLKISDLAFGSLFFRAFEGAVRGYFDAAGPPIGIPGEILWKAWSVSVMGLFVAALIGTRGGRIGWIVIGAVTCGIVAEGAPVQSRLAVVAITAVGWSLLSILSFWRHSASSDKNDSLGTRRGKGRKRAKRNSDEIAEENAIERGCADLSDYFDQYGHLKLSILANDLGVEVDEAKRLRREIAGITRASNISPARKREAIEKASTEGADLAELAKEYNVAQSTLRNWMKGNEVTKANQSKSDSQLTNYDG